MSDNKDVVKNDDNDCVKSGHESGHEFRDKCPDSSKEIIGECVSGKIDSSIMDKGQSVLYNESGNYE